MKENDIVQVRQFDGIDHWIYAKVLNAETRLVEIVHRGNAEHGRQMIVAKEDLRTKADVQALLDHVTGLAGARISDSQLRTLCQADGWFRRFMDADPQNRLIFSQREHLQRFLVKHYTAQVDRLS